MDTNIHHTTSSSTPARGVVIAFPRAAPPSILETLDAYAAAMQGRKIRQRGLEAYLRDIRHFVAWLGDAAVPMDITEAQIDAFKASMRDRSASTISQHLSAIRSYCRWCQRSDLRLDDPTVGIEWPKRTRRLPRALKRDELRQLERILDQPPPLLDRKKARLQRRNRLIVLLLLYAGLRRAEAAGLRWADVDLEEQLLRTRWTGAERLEL